jgi:hypothetical protein
MVSFASAEVIAAADVAVAQGLVLLWRIDRMEATERALMRMPRGPAASTRSAP